MPGVVPRMSQSPGSVDHLAPGLGQHNEEIYCGLLGYSPEKLEALKEEGSSDAQGFTLAASALGGVRKVPSPLVTLDANRIYRAKPGL